MSVSTYLGVELLDWVPEAVSSTDEPIAQTGSRFMPPGGGVAPAWADPNARWTRTFRYTVDTRQQRDDLALLYSFLDRRAGQFAPCWLPTWNDDLVPAGPLASGATTLMIATPSAAVIRALGTPALRYLAVLPAAGGAYPLAVGGLTDNGDGTSSLLITAYGGPALGNMAAGAPFWRLSALTYARLASDDVTIDFSTPGIVRAALPFLELPAEMP